MIKTFCFVAASVAIALSILCKSKSVHVPPCVRIVVASVFHKNITGSGKLDISEALS